MCFYLLLLYVRAQWKDRPLFNIYEVVDPWHCTMSNKLIMHKHAFRKIFTAWIPCYTFSATIATNWVMRLSFEQWMEQDVISWKTIFVKKLTGVSHVERNDGLSWERGKDNCVVGSEASFSYPFMHVTNTSCVLLSHPLHLVASQFRLNVSSRTSL